MNNRAKKTGFGLAIASLLCILPLKAHSVPVIYSFILDGTRSLNVEEWEQENRAAAEHLELIFARSQVNIGSLADWVGVHVFGGREDYAAYPYFNASHRSRIVLLQQTMLDESHPKYDHTAIFEAILNGVFLSLTHEEELGGDYFNVFILVTDGNDTNSSQEAMSTVNWLFPNDESMLIVIGVGDANVSQFRGVADRVAQIDSFAELALSLEVVLQAIHSAID